MDDDNEVADVLEAAADAIFVYGWTRGKGETEDGRMCALGAIQHVRGRVPREWSSDLFDKNLGVPDADPASLALSNWLAQDNDQFRSVYVWNDCAAEDADEVIDTLRLVAKSLRNGESV